MAILPGFEIACNTSSFKILPPVPLGLMVPASIFLSAMMAAATGVALTSLVTAITGAADG
jgi:hypothetical protein